MSKNGAQNNMKSFFWKSLFVMDFFSGKFATIRAKIIRTHPKKFACSYTIAVELTRVTSQGYVINIIEMGKY